ncbi:ParB N-terminal domain-containing protein [Streptomyces sp. NPDC006627]|uniref:ParB N-terminal domain-containing protein n=1 Tax=Streptomyces sp. NPDC006627 TaxID=3154679 RepID=UPI0033BA5ED2
MRTSYLNDRQIHPAEFATWAGARRYHERHRRDRNVLDQLRASIPQDGIQEPLLLGVRERDGFVFVYEGHHRAVIALELRLPYFPLQWFIDPNIRSVQNQPFPQHLLD